MDLKIDENASKILKKRYLDKGETPYLRYKNMADKIASAELTPENKKVYAEKFLNLFSHQELLPNSPTIMNYGKPNRQQQGSACFVLSIKDDLNDIFDTIRKAALIHKSGGGTGYNFSSLRPNGALVLKTGKPSSGVIPFLKAYDSATGAVSQGGTRRGANMGILNVTHPDILSFITCKSDENQIKNFNLSVGVTEEFFKAVEEDADWELYFKDKNGNKMPFYPNSDETKPLTTQIVIKARELYNMIIEHAHKNGEPGIVFVDRLQRANSVPSCPIDATNPCGEQPLPPENSCVLTSINLSKVVIIIDGKVFIDWDALDEIIRLGTRLLDDIVTVNEYPVDEIKVAHDAQRRIGLGITGLADVLIMLGIPYGSKEGREKAGQIMKFVDDRSHYWSFQLGKEKGNFPLFNESKFNLNGQYREEAINFYKSFLSTDELNELMVSGENGYMRNAATTTIAPTGTLTALLGAEGYGCEPLFALGYEKHVLNGEILPYTSKLFEVVAKREGFYSEELVKRVAQTGSVQVEEIPAKWKEVFKIANEIPVDAHINMQATLQKYCDSGISKTINMSSDATKEQVEQAYQQAYKSGVIKGLTVYRDKSRGEAPISIGTGNDKVIENKVEEKSKEIVVAPIARPKQTEGTTTQYNTGCGKMYLSVNHDDKSVIETFAFTGSTGGCQGLTEGLSRMTSLTIRLARAFADQLGLDTDMVIDSTMNEIIDQLKSVRCNVALRNKKAEGKSCPDIMGKALEKEYNKLRGKKVQKHNHPHEHDEGGCGNCANKGSCHGDKNGEIILDNQGISIKAPEIKVNHAEVHGEPCPECGTMLLANEGCRVCPNCAYSKC